VSTLPEATPVHEAARLQSDLARAEIHPFAWVINQALTAVETTDPVLSRRQLNERVYIEEVVEKHSKRVALVPWLTTPPVGSEGLRATLGEARLSPSRP
jgi:arsenite/tail-anchored protein-transporting ATPase